MFRERIVYALKRADLVTVNSENLKKQIVSLDIDSAKIKYVQDGVELDKFYDINNKILIKKELGWEDCPVVFTNRWLKPVYNMDIFVKSIPLVLKEAPGAKFVMLKNRIDEFEKLLLLCRRLGIEKKVIFINHIERDKLNRYYNASDIFVSLASWDGASKSLLEAMACGCAPVVSDTESNREWVTDGVNGAVVGVRDEKRTADAIIYLLKNPEARQRCARFNRRLIEEKADYYEHMKKMEGLYKSVIKNGDKKC